MQATFADFLRYRGSAVLIEPGQVKPVLRVPLESVPAPERPRMERELLMARRHKIYQVLVERDSPHHFAVQVYPFTGHAVLPTLSASRSWYEGAHHLRQALFRILSSWSDIAPDMPLPWLEDAVDWGQHRVEYARRMKYAARAGELAQTLGVDGDGWVPNGRYKEAKRMREEQLAAWDEEVEGGPYPFQDGAPSWFVRS